MHFRFVALFLIPTLCAAQIPSASQAQNQQPATVVPSGSIVVPPGTNIQLTLVSPIHSKTTKPGAPVRAVVAFPVAVGTQIAIPAGAYLEGVVDAIIDPHGPSPRVRLHFTRVLFSTGYSAPLDASNTDAMMIEAAPLIGQLTADYLADARDGAPQLGNAFAVSSAATSPTLPPLPPLPNNGPNVGALIGITAGVGAAGLVLTLVLAHHRLVSTDYVLFDEGWQFQIVLDQPLTLDAVQAARAAALPVTATN